LDDRHPDHHDAPAAAPVAPPESSDAALEAVEEQGVTETSPAPPGPPTQRVMSLPNRGRLGDVPMTAGYFIGCALFVAGVVQGMPWVLALLFPLFGVLFGVAGSGLRLQTRKAWWHLPNTLLSHETPWVELSLPAHLERRVVSVAWRLECRALLVAARPPKDPWRVPPGGDHAANLRNKVLGVSRLDAARPTADCLRCVLRPDPNQPLPRPTPRTAWLVAATVRFRNKKTETWFVRLPPALVQRTLDPAALPGTVAGEAGSSADGSVRGMGGCPACFTPLPEEVADEQTCANCQGTLLSVQGLSERVLSRIALTEQDLRELLAATGSHSSRLCGRCGGSMRAVRLKGSHVQVCGRCGGCFLDEAARRRVEQAVRDIIGLG
jgi:hypothetical protein